MIIALDRCAILCRQRDTFQHQLNQCEENSLRVIWETSKTSLEELTKKCEEAKKRVHFTAIQLENCPSTNPAKVPKIERILEESSVDAERLKKEEASLQLLIAKQEEAIRKVDALKQQLAILKKQIIQSFSNKKLCPPTDTRSIYLRSELVEKYEHLGKIRVQFSKDYFDAANHVNDLALTRSKVQVSIQECGTKIERLQNRITKRKHSSKYKVRRTALKNWQGLSRCFQGIARMAEILRASYLNTAISAHKELGNIKKIRTEVATQISERQNPKRKKKQVIFEDEMLAEKHFKAPLEDLALFPIPAKPPVVVHAPNPYSANGL